MDDTGTSGYVADFNITNSTRGEEIDPFYFFKSLQFTVLWIMFFSIVIGNGAVLACLFMNNARKSSRTKYFIMHLAIADLLVGMISVMSDIVWRMIVVWEVGWIPCKVVKFAQALVTYYSTYVLVALSIDRFDAITRPMNFRGSWRRAHLLVIFSWVISIIFSLPVSYLAEVAVVQGTLQCWIEMSEWQWQLYMSLVALTVFIIPAIIITMCYIFIVRTIWSKSQILSPRRMENGKGHEDHDIRRSSSRGIIPRAKIKTVKMTFVIVFVFILCWSPYIFFDLLQVYGFIPRSQTGVAIASFIQSLAPLNSAANPVIYCLFSTRICNSLSEIPPFSWIVCCGRESQEPSTCTETLTSTSTNRSRSLSHFRVSSTRPRPQVNNHRCYESNHHDALL